MNYQTTFQQAEQPSQTNLSCQSYIGSPSGGFPKHCHSYYELSYICQGRRYETLNHTRYEVSEHSLIFIPPLAIHGLQNQTAVEDVVIQFSQPFLRHTSALFNPNCRLHPVKEHGYFFQLNPQDELCRILDSIRQICNLRRCNSDASLQDKIQLDLKQHSLCINLISAMLENGLLTIDPNGASYSEIISLDPLIHELLQHPGEPLSMQKASHMAGLSYSHFSRVFTRITGFHYANFCNLLRIRQAEELLLTTSLSITEVAAAIGIDTLPYFTRLFKQINGESPSAYRKRY